MQGAWLEGYLLVMTLKTDILELDFAVMFRIYLARKGTGNPSCTASLRLLPGIVGSISRTLTGLYVRLEAGPRLYFSIHLFLEEQGM